VTRGLLLGLLAHLGDRVVELHADRLQMCGWWCNMGIQMLDGLLDDVVGV
jgi:hypothetical protein